ncbi:PREDICTED: secretoglobin family 1D member 2-like [Hipposideros armiger]|uniref:Secretoglobin family 1D member 2-like n=1 Tax=Hipposideros armiger TaxID=186990 RepID=A0A8B7SE04_HIPAR|nr:PREDICTED: secretoglobin family 1D member 2-like [Hipposideros armiger]
MSLAFPVLLVTLAFCCYEANARVCPALVSELRSFLFEPTFLYRLNVLKFNAPPEIAQSKVEVKKCINSDISFFKRLQFLPIMMKVLAKC